MSFNRLPYDTCSYKHNLAETVGPGVYQLLTPPNNCEPCLPNDPYIRLQRQGVSLSKNTPLVDIDSELIGISRNLSDCPELKYLPSKNNQSYCGAHSNKVVGCQKNAKVCVDNTNVINFKDCFKPTEDTRLSNPPCTLRGTGWNRWEWLCRNPQERIEVPFDFEINSTIVAKDNHRPCIPNPLDQTNALPTPEDKPYCETIVPVCMVPTDPPSVHWQHNENVSKY